mmetsp:Transcript_796/g.2703  ORF Transcript_796/g.2703 Transcript_796/m.2703 type:complete len:498 (+) Transcript_796:103-1596(+)
MTEETKMAEDPLHEVPLATQKKFYAAEAVLLSKEAPRLFGTDKFHLDALRAQAREGPTEVPQPSFFAPKSSHDVYRARAALGRLSSADAIKQLLDAVAAAKSDYETTPFEGQAELDYAIQKEVEAAAAAAAAEAEATAKAEAEAVTAREQDTASSTIQRLVRGYVQRRRLIRTKLEETRERREGLTERLRTMLLEKGAQCIKFNYNGGYPKSERIVWLTEDEDHNVARICVGSRGEYQRRESIGFSQKGVTVTDIADVRKGASTYAIRIAAEDADPERCLSIVGSERTLDLMMLDKATRDTLYEALLVYVDASVPEDTKRTRQRETWALRVYPTLAALSSPIRLSMADVVEVARFRDILAQGIGCDFLEPQAVVGGFRRTTGVIWLDTARQRLFLLPDKVEGVAPTAHGVDVNDVSEVRPGRSSMGFLRMGNDAEEDIYITIIGSERSLYIVGSSPNASRQFISRLRAMLKVDRNANEPITRPVHRRRGSFRTMGSR